MGEMEDAVLQNSKGATYMSFVLDVEVILKRKKGAQRANLAESKVKSESQVPTKKGEKEKVVKQPEQNKDITTPPPQKKDITTPPPEKKKDITPTPDEKKDIITTTPKKEDLKVYAATLDPLNIFEQRALTKIKSSTPLEECSTSIKQSESTTAPVIDNPIETSPKRHRAKKKLKKVNEKSKVFKGKIEKIDFLECNRIFMCNYLKIQNNKSFYTGAKNQRQSEPNTTGLNTKMRYRNHKTVSDHKSKFTTRGTLGSTINKSIFTKKRGAFSSVVGDVNHHRNHSTGCVNRNPEVFFDDLSIANLKRKVNAKTVVSSDSYKTIHRSGSRQHKKNFCKQYISCQNLLSGNEQLIEKIIKRNKSLPSNFYEQELSGYKFSYKNTNEAIIRNCFNGDKNKILVEPIVLKHRANVHPAGLSDLEIKVVHKSERLIRPHAHRETRLNCTRRNYQLKGVTSICEASNVEKQFIVSRSKSLDHVHQFYKDFSNKQIVSIEIKNHTQVLQKYDPNIIKGNKFRKKKSIWKIINSFILECVMKQCEKRE